MTGETLCEDVVIQAPEQHKSKDKNHKTIVGVEVKIKSPWDGFSHPAQTWRTLADKHHIPDGRNAKRTSYSSMISGITGGSNAAHPEPS
jgi:hypothetical protein